MSTVAPSGIVGLFLMCGVCGAGHTYDTPPSYVGVSAVAYGTGAISVNVASNYQSGDLLLLLMCGYDGEPSTPEGWTSIDTQNSSGHLYLNVCYKFAGASESAVSVADTGAATSGVMLAFSGVDSGSPVNTNTKNTDTGTTFSATGVTTTVTNCMIVVCVAFSDAGTSNDTSNYSSWANANLSSITERVDSYSYTSTNVWAGLACAYGVKVSAGATGATTATTDAASNSSSIITIALTPAA